MKSTNIVFISQFLSRKSFGASKVSISNVQLLSNVHNLTTISWAENSIADISIKPSRRIFNKGLMLILGLSGNLSLAVFNYIFKILPSLEKKKQIIWIDSSLLGHLVFFFHLLGFKTIVFFHNCEIDLLEIENKTILSMLRNRSIKISERLAIKYADKIVSITYSDSDRINEYYNRKVDFILPPFFSKLESGNNIYEKNVGFLGSDWYPNLQALEFILELAIDLPDYNFFIGGEICNRVNNTTPKNVILLGYIDDISVFYKNIHTILSPVIFGGGIKIKVLEAIQYSKLVIGSQHSINGFESYKGICYFIASDKKDYIDLIKKHTGVMQVNSLEINRAVKSQKNSLYLTLNDIHQELIKN